MSIETVKVFIDTEEVGYVELPEIDLDTAYSLCIWDKWLNEKPNGVQLDTDIASVNKDNLRLFVGGIFYKYDNDSFKWLNEKV